MKYNNDFSPDKNFLQKYFFRRSYQKVLNEYTFVYGYKFSDPPSSQIEKELDRCKRTIFYALDDYFVYGWKQRPLWHIIQQ